MAGTPSASLNQPAAAAAGQQLPAPPFNVLLPPGRPPLAQPPAPTPSAHLLPVPRLGCLAAPHRVVLNLLPADHALPVAIEPLHELVVVLQLALAQRGGVELLQGVQGS
jgi:hypothetical protein